MAELERDGDVWVLRMDDGENRFNRGSIDSLHACLDQVEATVGPAALVTTGAGKFYSNGLDLDWVMAGEGTEGFIDDVHRLFGRVLALPMYAVAAVNGHAFAGGAMLASCHDVVVMREDRGYWCLPEVDLGLPLTPAMFAAVQSHLPPKALAEATLTAKRYSGPEAVAAGVAEEAVADDQVVPRAVELARAMAPKDRSVIAAHKQLLRADLIRACGVEPG